MSTNKRFNGKWRRRKKKIARNTENPVSKFHWVVMKWNQHIIKENKIEMDEKKRREKKTNKNKQWVENGALGRYKRNVHGTSCWIVDIFLLTSNSKRYTSDFPNWVSFIFDLWILDFDKKKDFFFVFAKIHFYLFSSKV